MKGPRYNSAHWWQPWLARITLGLVFGLTLFYPLIIGAAILAAQWWPHYVAIVAALAVATVIPAIRSFGADGGGDIWPGFARNVVFESWRARHPLHVVRETRPFTGPALFLMVPHGVFPLGLPLLAGVYEEHFPELLAHKSQPRAAVASIFFWIPFLSPLVRWLGGIPAHKHNIQDTLLKERTSCFIFPDGVAGSFYGTDPDAERICISTNKAELIGHACGVPIIPVYCFGHTTLFHWSWPRSAHSWLARISRWLRFAFIAYWPVLPKEGTPITLVFGQPLGADEPFERAIADLYARHRHALGYGARRLEIVK